jgi:hypothetical protein
MVSPVFAEELVRTAPKAALKTRQIPIENEGLKKKDSSS